jgi:murein DD-endopeptidase MepM/ murein hydrolase activator NlpD
MRMEARLSAVKRYKDIEKSLARRFVVFTLRIFASIGLLIARFFRAGRQKITIMLVPHTEKRILNLQISFFGLGFFIIFGVALIAGLSFSTATYGEAVAKLAGKSDTLKSTQADLDAIRDSTTRLVKAARSFQATLDSTFATIGMKGSPSQAVRRDGDLSAFFESADMGSGRLREVVDIERVTGYLEQSIQPLKELGATVAAQGSILTEIPNLWPIRGGIGHISMHYGQNENPIYGSWYMHRGIDISTFRSGDPIVATADGKVVTVAYDQGLGNYIILEHKHGFLTRYAHMKAFNVQKGQTVQQGQVIGFIGNTGLSTGPHLHYEVHLGSETIDPLRFLNIRPTASALTQ